ncbi:hypothetical protein D3870_20835 [Noviherbaspirillum cavernae]|uniref:Uncharacterized protein n=1 Tax=Noviherbaspirillum cavernae TaxID=2320862 RepID=A0A418WWC6_9BURK|nr:hypothetical protein [Noviherbaspirillum cavernae]RJF96831.1 hypothetical protein D3870_20835 [Noviherbaspirillum cavernae]
MIVIPSAAKNLDRIRHTHEPSGLSPANGKRPLLPAFGRKRLDPRHDGIDINAVRAQAVALVITVQIALAAIAQDADDGTFLAEFERKKPPTRRGRRRIAAGLLLPRVCP